jgi:glycosyltransferase involved in cell wall biosynthesis
VSRARRHEVAIYSPWASVIYAGAGTQTGGAELQTTLLARGLVAQGMNVAHVVYPLGSPPVDDPHRPALVERAVHQRKQRFGEAREMAAIWRVLRATDAEIYLVRGGGGHVPAAASFAKAFRRRFVFSSSSELDFDFARPGRNARVLRANRASMTHADRLVVQTEAQRTLARSTLGDVDPVVIPSFAEPAEPATGEAQHFLWINRLVPYKQPERFMELAAALPEARFTMIGATTEESPRGYEEEVRRAAEPLPNLELLEPRPREQLLAEVRRAAAVVTTSSIEGMPNTFLEAWARGVPVLSLVVDPDSRLAGDGLGLLAGGSMERFIEQAASLWRDPALRAEIGERGRAFVKRTHSPAAVASRWAELLRGLLRS